MTTLALVLPLARTSHVHIPRRDLVLSAADSLTLNIQLIEADNRDAVPITVTGGVGGPGITMYVWPVGVGRGAYDYGAPAHMTGPPLWSGDGTITDMPSATFAISIPPAIMGGWPLRCCWAVVLTDDHGDAVQMLASGFLHVRQSGQRTPTPTAIESGPDTLILVA